MSVEWVLYFISILGHLSLLLAATAIISLLTFFVFLWKKDEDLPHDWQVEKYDTYMKYFKINSFWCIGVFLISNILNTLIPSQGTMYAIVLANYSKKSNIPIKVLKLIELKLDEVIEKIPSIKIVEKEQK